MLTIKMIKLSIFGVHKNAKKTLHFISINQAHSPTGLIVSSVMLTL
jgi:hypothetical protein